MGSKKNSKPVTTIESPLQYWLRRVEDEKLDALWSTKTEETTIDRDRRIALTLAALDNITQILRPGHQFSADEVELAEYTIMRLRVALEVDTNWHRKPRSRVMVPRLTGDVGPDGMLTVENVEFEEVAMLYTLRDYVEQIRVGDEPGGSSARYRWVSKSAWLAWAVNNCGEDGYRDVQQISTIRRNSDSTSSQFTTFLTKCGLQLPHSFASDLSRAKTPPPKEHVEGVLDALHYIVNGGEGAQV